MNLIYMPPNLAALGVRRATPDGAADLITIAKTPYPVLSSYKEVCRRMGLPPFGGGTHENQGSRGPGFITSGYRDDVMENRGNSPHRFALAIDVIAGDLGEQITMAEAARDIFCRIGLYPHNGFIHMDLCNDLWMKAYGGRAFWVRGLKGIYTSFDTLDAAVLFAQQGG